MYSRFVTNHTSNWRKNGVSHRMGFKPACILHSFGGEVVLNVQYWVEGVRYFLIDGVLSVKSKLGFIYGSDTYSSKNPEFIYSNGTKEWHLCGKLHRDADLPAIEYSNGDCEYWNYGKRHRLNGPAVIYGNKQYWFINGEFLRCIV